MKETCWSKGDLKRDEREINEWIETNLVRLAQLWDKKPGRVDREEKDLC